MKWTALTLDQYLLNLSGLLAIALCAWVSSHDLEPLPNLAIYLVFAIAFFVESFAKPLGVKTPVAKASILLMIPLSVAALLVSRDTIALILTVVLLASAPHHFSARASWLIMAICNICFAIVFWVFETPLEHFIYHWMTQLALQIFALTSSLAKQREVVAQEELTRKNSELLATRAVLAGQNRAEERLRIAGDLHDGIGHRLTALQLQLEVLSHTVPSGNKSQVETCQTLAKDLLEEVRSIVRQMAEGESNDLTDAIRELEALTPGVEISLASQLPVLEPTLAQQLVFCIQEAVHNAIRHGRASRVDIRGDEHMLTVTDNGYGLAGKVVMPGFGLRNINKRLASVGGHAELLPAGDSGCELQLYLSETRTA